MVSPEFPRRTLLTLGNDANVVYEYNLASRLTRVRGQALDFGVTHAGEGKGSGFGFWCREELSQLGKLGTHPIFYSVHLLSSFLSLRNQAWVSITTKRMHI
jgi:hypothetical protein